MKMIIFCLLIFLCHCTLLAQEREFAPVGAEWHYAGRDFRKFVKKFVVEKDTILLGKEVRKINVSLFSHGENLINYQQIYFHVDGDQVYHFVQDTFYLLYDFAAKTGDSWRVELLREHNNEFANREEDWHGIVTVDSVETVNIDGMDLKKQFLSLEIVNVPEEALIGWLFNYAIEYIGSDYLLIDTQEDFPQDHRINCYRDEHLNYKNPLVPTDCDEITTTAVDNYSMNKKYYTVSPIPVTDRVEINAITKKVNNYYLFDTSGKLVTQREQIDVTSAEIFTNHLPSGLYHLVINKNTSNTAIFSVVIF